MTKYTKRLILALFLFFLAIVCVIALIIIRKHEGTPLEWWDYLDMLSLFLASFTFLVSALYAGKLPYVSTTLAHYSIAFAIFAFLWILCSSIILYVP